MAKKKLEPAYRVGQIVEIQSESFGWATMCKGDFAKVMDVKLDAETFVYVLQEIQNRCSKWNCLEKDIVAWDTQSKEQMARYAIQGYKSFLRRMSNFAKAEQLQISAKLADMFQELQKTALLEKSLCKYVAGWSAGVTEYMEEKDAGAKFTVLLATRYEKIDFVDTDIKALTKPIVVIVKGVTLELGRFTVTIHWRDGLITINREFVDVEFNRKHNSTQHPHILDGKPCLGDYQLPLTQALCKDDYLEALVVIHEYLQQVYPGSVYGHPLLWASDRMKRCRNCYALLDMCRCGSKYPFNPVDAGDEIREGEEGIVVAALICAHCNQPEEGCACFFCPQSGDFVSTDGELDDGCDNCSNNDDGVCHG